MFRQIIVLLIVIVIFGSCRQSRDMIYMNGLDSLQYHTYRPSPNDEYRVQSMDKLYLRIVSDNEEINNIFNNSLMGGNKVSGYDQVSMYFQGYNVDEDGNIILPIIGDVNVKGKTVNEIEDIIQPLVENYIKEVTVIVKLASFKITFLGEIGNPGVHYFYQEKTSVFEAIAVCGDITEYGNRKSVLVVRPTETGNVTFRIDLTDKDILNTDLYYFKPNDLVYVEPVKSKGLRLFAADYGTLITLFSTTTTVIFLIITIFT